MSNYFTNENTVKACVVTIRDYNNRIIVTYPSLFPKQATDDAKELAAYYRPKTPFRQTSWEVEIDDDGCRTSIWDIVK